jgi:two-component system LytT family sensor kinase
MKRSLSLNNYFLQFVMLVLLNFAFGSITFLLLKNLGFIPPASEPPASEPLGASDFFIAYNNLLKALLAVLVIHFYKQWHAIYQNSFLKYLLLGIILYVANSMINMLIAAALLEPVNIIKIFWDPSGPFFFKLNLIFSSLLVYHWSLREDKKISEQLNQRLELSALRELKAKAELEALQAKVNPHFLYNSLNSINTLIDQQPTKAKEMIFLLSKLFRLSINVKDDLYATISEELELVKTYLCIEQIRFGERLKVEIHCDPSLMDYVIPKFLLQPLVENAMIHGISQITGAGHVTIFIIENGGFLEIQVRDNGPSFKADFQKGYGLQGVQDKIKMLAGEGAAFEIVGAGNHMPVNGIAGPWKYVGIKIEKRKSSEGLNN